MAFVKNTLIGAKKLLDNNTKMKRLKEYLVRNILNIIYTFLTSVFFAFLIFPVLVKLKFVRSILGKTTIKPFIAFTALVLLFIFYSWKGARSLLERYKNTYKLETRLFVSIDYIILFFISSVLLIVLFQVDTLPILSPQSKNFLRLNFLLIIGWFLSSFFWKKKKQEHEISDIDVRSLSDEPIQSAKQDSLGRDEFISGLYKEIISFPFSEAFVFGLYGGWGEGKTSIINLLIEKSKDNEDLLVVNFDPWNYKGVEAILAAFYDQIEKIISEKFIFPHIKKTFRRYQKIISLGLSQAGIKIDFSNTEESLEEVSHRIESYIKQTKKKLIIFIDDIDRLQPAEVLYIFKLVRLNAKFQNTIFFLSFDPIVVQDYLRENLKIDPEFLDKIIQKPVQLPAIEQRDIDEFLDAQVNKIFDELAISKENRGKIEKDFPYIYMTQIRKLFKTLRQAKRYLNSLRSTLPPIKNEINLYDLIILEAIKVFYPVVYNDIWRNPWFYIPLDWSDMTYFLSPFSFVTKEDEKYSKIKDHIEGIVRNAKEGEILKELLKTIFFVEVKNALDIGRTDHESSAVRYRTEKRLTHPESFRKYFMLKVPPLEISDEFIETTLDLWHSTAELERESIIEKTIFNLQRKEKLLEYFKKLIVFIDKIERDIAPDIIRVIYKNAVKFSKKGTENLGNSEYDTARILLVWLINDKVEKQKIQDLLEEVVAKSPSMPFVVLIVSSCRQGRSSLYNIYDSIKIEELQNKAAVRLKEYFVDEKRDIFEEFPEENDWVFVLYQWATNWMTFVGDNNKIVGSYVFSLIKDDAKKFIKFLMQQRQQAGPNAGTFNLEELARLYDLTEFQKLAEKFKDDASLSSDEKGVVGLFLKLYNDKKARQTENKKT